MGDNSGKDSSAESMDPRWVLALEAAPPPSSSLRLPKPKKMKPHVNEKKHEGFHWDILTINQGQDIGEKVLNYFQNSTNNSENSNGHAWRGIILHATGSILHPRMNIENSSAFNKGPCNILALGGRYIISEDGQVQEHGPLMISISNPSCVVVRGQVIGRLVAAGSVQGSCTILTLGGRYIISEDGKVQQHGPLMISTKAFGHLVAAGHVQVLFTSLMSNNYFFS